MLDQRILDGYANYIHQVFLQESSSGLMDPTSSDPKVRLYQAWHENPKIAQGVVAMFHHKFSPEIPEESAKPYQETDVEEWKKSDFGPMICAIEQTVRTNFYCVDAKALVIKIRHPNGVIETFMDHPLFQGVMLKGAMMARGGLRWSEREDFRSECWQLMQTQILKNTIIVPSGSKGAFLLKSETAEPLEAYELFVQGILDVSDNLEGRTVLSPPRVRCYDGHDFYNVVAADKGTASFSDHGNAIALRYGYWLGDAFASGGSNGYSHKKLAITSRGTWVSIRHHLDRLGFAWDRPLRIVGIGDMAGDVFGNGMLEEGNIQLLAAFNHESIFIDPNPNPDASYHERCRLFHLPRSRWSDYGAFSLGGAVYDRFQPHIELSQQACDLLGVSSSCLTPNAVIQEILKMPVDVLFLGGIGTFIQGQSEKNIMDTSNAGVRVYGKDLRAKIVAEGANLGMTQAGRIEYALTGGLVNTDAVDNCAGVNCSDHEINIKILLNQIGQEGGISESDRSHLLKGITDDVCALVLKENAWQNLALTFSAMNKPSVGVEDVLWFLEEYRAHNTIDDGSLGVLTDALGDRKTQGGGVTRTELAVVLSYGKRRLREILNQIDLSDLGNDEVVRYFPRMIQEQFSSFLKDHLLFSDLKMTMMGNRFVDLLGPMEIFLLARELDIPLTDLVRSLVILDHHIKGYRMGQKIEGIMNDMDSSLELMGLYRDVVCGGLRHWGKHWKSNPCRLISVADVSVDPLLWDRYQNALSVITYAPMDM